MDAHTRGAPCGSIIRHWTIALVEFLTNDTRVCSFQKKFDEFNENAVFDQSFSRRWASSRSWILFVLFFRGTMFCVLLGRLLHVTYSEFRPPSNKPGHITTHDHKGRSHNGKPRKEPTPKRQKEAKDKKFRNSLHYFSLGYEHCILNSKGEWTRNIQPRQRSGVEQTRFRCVSCEHWEKSTSSHPSGVFSLGRRPPAYLCWFS